ncbi:hypothetical protein DSL72_008815 [Monilinia vaccinii-corymbosi]|uniref:Mediator of RNA polymerase II transcription subunit 22 n=1 Tax=Monilinia vaccinii-corymbosi TaxID=61207 RepID=A0A8A3PSI8_9HELO|nr:hypothetical protein DSL72_008815 [Monilinia vaccinii-corymbosi]
MSNPNLLGAPGRGSMVRRGSNESIVTNKSTISNASDISIGLGSASMSVADTLQGLIPSQPPLESIIQNPKGPSISENESLPHSAESAPKTRPLNPHPPELARGAESSHSSLYRSTTVVAPAAVAIAKNSNADEYIDRQQRAIAALLTRFKNLVLLAALPTGDAFTKETAAAEGLRMEVESNALTSAAEDLLKLTRELKELWTFGPLRELGEGEGDGEMEADSLKVAELIEKQLEKRHEQEKNI